MKYGIYVKRGIHDSGKLYDVYGIFNADTKRGIIINNWRKNGRVVGSFNLKSGNYLATKRYIDLYANKKVGNGYVFSDIETIYEGDEYFVFLRVIEKAFKFRAKSAFYDGILEKLCLVGLEPHAKVGTITPQDFLNGPVGVQESDATLVTETPKPNKKFIEDPLWGCW